MPDGLHVVALISGGKDSLFSILHCSQNGHNVVALANLHPPARPTRLNRDGSNGSSAEEEEEEDMSSFMYQTVGHQVIPLYADAFELPLYRREITGSALQKGRYYDTSEQTHHGDETEDLLQLLQDVLKSQPDVNAVSSGAILSTYQRTRVESVALRLGLTPLAYLWQYPALPPPSERTDSLTGLLDDMAAAKCDARIIKIASGGMKENLLWSSVTDPRTKTRLVSGMAPFFPGHEFWLRGAVLGEGGEYETLAVDGPRPLWKKRLVFDEEKTKTVTGEGGVYHAILGNPTAVNKAAGTGQENDEGLVRVPIPYDVQFKAIRDRVSAPEHHITTPPDQFVASNVPQLHHLPKAVLKITSTVISLSNVVASDVGLHESAQMNQIVKQVRSSLNSIDPPLSASNAVSVLLLLSSMSDFATINPIYATLFSPGEPNPPARVTVATDLPKGVKVSISLVLSLTPRSQLSGLHVQSRSYWAPANIGPYSQAICEPAFVHREEVNVHDASQLEIVHVAGQIPLVPQSMDMMEATFEEQAVLSLQHLWRIGQERGVDIWPWGVAFLPSVGLNDMRVQLGFKVWLGAHTTSVSGSDLEDSVEGEEEDQDVWYSQNNRFGGSSQSANRVSCGEHLHPLPNHIVVDCSTLDTSICPPFLAAEVVSLPRDAPIEWWSLGVANIFRNSGRGSFANKPWAWGSVDVLTIPIECNTDSSTPSSVFFMLIILFGEAPSDKLPSLSLLMNDMGLTDNVNIQRLTTVQSTALISHQSTRDISEACNALKLTSSPAYVPCRRLWASICSHTHEERSLHRIDAALMLRIEGC